MASCRGPLFFLFEGSIETDLDGRHGLFVPSHLPTSGQDLIKDLAVISGSFEDCDSGAVSFLPGLVVPGPALSGPWDSGSASLRSFGRQGRSALKAKAGKKLRLGAFFALGALCRQVPLKFQEAIHSVGR